MNKNDIYIKDTQFSEDGCKNLAMQVVKQAIVDYKKALKKKDKYECANLERFFRSAWYSVLCSVDGDYIIELVKEVVNEENNKRNDSKRAKEVYTKRNEKS